MPTPSLADRRTFLATARTIAEETRLLIHEARTRNFSVDVKPDDTFVTEVDLAVERHVRERLAERFPDHGIVGEEYADRLADAPLQWVIDPIDGTHSFRHGVPLYGTLLALLHEGLPLLGLIDLPGLAVCVSGGPGLGVARNGHPLRLADLAPDADLASNDNLAREIIAVGERKQFVNAGQTALFDRLMTEHAHTRTYCDAFGHVLALEGAVGAMVDTDLKRWDVAATEALIHEAGGALVCFAEHHPADGPARYDVVFGKPRVVDWIVDTFL